MKRTLTAEQAESFLALWERSIGLSDPNRRAAMEAERERIWTGNNRTIATARSVLANITRHADTTTDDGADLAMKATALRASLAGRAST
jgi:hypothetical protein